MDSLSHLKLVLHKDRAPTQNAVLKSLLKGNNTGHKIAEDTGLSDNAVNIALYQLTKHGVINRVKLGTYKANENLIYLALIPTQNAVLKSLLKGHETNRKIAEDTGLSYNAVSIALHHLAKHGSIQRVKRGTYKANENFIHLALMDSLTKLEGRLTNKVSLISPRVNASIFNGDRRTGP